MVKDQILKDLKRAVKELGYTTTDIVLSIPKNPAFGDYSTNVALQLAKLKSGNAKQNPVKIANEIISNLGHLGYLSKTEIGGEGFINFFINAKNLTKDIAKILAEKENFGKSSLGKGKKARVEYISANPTGPLHIGNARSGPLGDVIANVLSFCGYQVLREYLDNNVGEQVKALGATIKARYHGNQSDQDQYQGQYIDDLVRNLGDQIEKGSDEDVGEMAVEQIYEDILADAHDMGIKFDLVVHESDLRKKADAVIKELKKAGVVKEKEGALWLAPNDEYLKDRETVIQKSDGSYTYFTADIVYHQQKFASGADPIINVWGSNHHGHIPRILAAMKALGFDPGKLKVVLYQYVRVKRGESVVKMSKRAGNFVTAREVLDEVGKDAFRFYLLRFSPQTHLDFDLELVKRQTSKNPVYYVQYAHARMANIIRKVQSSKFKVQSLEEVDFGLLELKAEIDLIKHLIGFPDLVEELSSSLAVHQLTEYAISLADLFHRFYESCPVLQAQNSQLTLARLALVSAAKTVLANTLQLLGVSAPERM